MSPNHVPAPCLAPPSFLAALLAASGALSGCYGAQFDAFASGVYACEIDDDCQAEFSCLRGVCVDDDGPKLEILGPETLTKFSEGVTEIPLTVSLADVELAEPGGSHQPGKAYLEVWIDGLPVNTREGGNPLSDAVGSSVTVPAVELPDGIVYLGEHRLRVEAFQLDGQPYSNPSAEARRMFFIANATTPQIAVLSPWPGDEQRADQTMLVEIAAVNWTWTDPVPGGMDDSQGHTHVYFNKDFPDCLPGCNFDYADGGALTRSANLDPLQPNVLRAELEIAEADATPGDFTVSAGLNWDSHIPWPAATSETVDVDAVRDQLEHDSVTVQLVVD
jgi:hypothetical protein